MNTEDCARYVKEWLKCDDEVKRQNEQLKLIKEKQKNLSNYIIQYMTVNNITNLTFDGGQIERNVKKKMGTLSKKYVSTKLKEYFNNDENKTNELLDSLLNNREVKEITSLINKNKKSTP